MIVFLPPALEQYLGLKCRKSQQYVAALFQDYVLLASASVASRWRRAVDLLLQRILVISLLAWLPLLLLSALEGQMLGGGAAVPFLLDVEVHIRFLVALPLLIVAGTCSSTGACGWW